MTLDERIKKDLAERLKGNPITAAQKLAPLAKADKKFQFSTKGLPTYFTGDTDAKTVFVQLNPGMDADLADERWDFDTQYFSEENFIEDYKESRRNYGKNDRLRYDSFDVKQAAFLYGWEDSGINFPEIEWSILDKEQRKHAKETSWLSAKEHVLMDKLQLELIPYASRKFDIDPDNIYLLDEYVEILLDEIFRTNRTYVIFGGTVFDDLFQRFPDAFKDLTEKKSIDLNGLQKADGTPWTSPLYYKIIEMYYNGHTQKALIAYTFPHQGLSNAFGIMGKYGRQCYEELKPYLEK